MSTDARPRDAARIEAAWAERVRANRDQAERLRETTTGDHYAPISSLFVADPRRTDEPVVDRRTAMLIGSQGLIIAVGCLFAFSFAYYLENRWSVLDLVRACVGLDFDQLRAMFTVPDAVREQVLGRARTIGFVVLAFSQDFHSYNCRSQTESLFKLGVFSNRYLVGATLVSMTLNGMAIYNPFFQRVLKTQPLLWSELALVVAVASMPLWVTEVVKAVTRSRRNKSA